MRRSHMLHRILVPIAVLLCATIGDAAAVRHSASSDLMQRKTEHAQRILKYLAMGRLDSVRVEADKLEATTTQAGFDGKSDQYANYGKEFIRLTRELSKEAANGNLAGSYYQFTRMTSVCFSCHEHIRDAERAR
jgi:hypothetical protein